MVTATIGGGEEMSGAPHLNTYTEVPAVHLF